MTTQPRPCYRHRRTVWIVSCADCTEYHLTAALARRDQDRTTTRRLATAAA